MTPPNVPDRDDPAAPASLAGRPRILVVGAGAIGGVVAAKLARAGHDVTALDANREHVAFPGKRAAKRRPGGNDSAPQRLA